MTPIHRLHLLLDHHREQMRAYAQGMLPLWKAGRLHDLEDLLKAMEYWPGSGSPPEGQGWKPYTYKRGPKKGQSTFVREKGAAPRAAKETPKRARRKAPEGPSTFDRSPIERAPKGQGSWQGDPAAVQAAVRAVKDAVSKDETRHGLTGIHREVVERDGKMFLRLAGTDGHRLHIAEVEGTGGEPGQIGHRPATLEQMAKDPMDTSFDRAVGEFPEFDQVVPSADRMHSSVMDKRALVRAVTTLKAQLGREDGSVRFVPKDGGFDLYAQDFDGTRVGDPVHIASDTKAPTSDRASTRVSQFSLNPDYLLDALRSSSGASVEFGHRHGLAPIAIRGALGDKVRTQHIVMPFRADDEMKTGERRKDRLAREAQAEVDKFVDEAKKSPFFNPRWLRKQVRKMDGATAHAVAEKLTGKRGGSAKESRDLIVAHAKEQAAGRGKGGTLQTFDAVANSEEPPGVQHDQAVAYIDKLREKTDNRRVYDKLSELHAAHERAYEAHRQLWVAEDKGSLDGKPVTKTKLRELRAKAKQARSTALGMHDRLVTEIDNPPRMGARTAG